MELYIAYTADASVCNPASEHFFVQGPVVLAAADASTACLFCGVRGVQTHRVVRSTYVDVHPHVAGHTSNLHAGLPEADREENDLLRRRHQGLPG